MSAYERWKRSVANFWRQTRRHLESWTSYWISLGQLSNKTVTIWFHLSQSGYITPTWRHRWCLMSAHDINILASLCNAFISTGWRDFWTLLSVFFNFPFICSCSPLPSGVWRAPLNTWQMVLPWFLNPLFKCGLHFIINIHYNTSLFFLHILYSFVYFECSFRRRARAHNRFELISSNFMLLKLPTIIFC